MGVSGAGPRPGGPGPQRICSRGLFAGRLAPPRLIGWGPGAPLTWGTGGAPAPASFSLLYPNMA